MSDVKLLTVAKFGSVGEAEALKLALELEGIPCILGNSATLGIDLGEINLQIAESNWDAAQEVLKSHSTGSATSWTCPACKASVEADFEVCWQCGAERPA